MIAIIGILIGLCCLPSIQRQKPDAEGVPERFKQLSLASFDRVEQRGWYPTGGWGWNWVGDPDRGLGKAQPGGWTYNIFAAWSSTPCTTWERERSAVRQEGIGRRIESTVVPTSAFYPSHRAACKLYPFTTTGNCPGGQPVNASTLEEKTRK